MFIKKLILGLLSFYAFEVKQSSKKFDLNPLSFIVTERQLETRKKRVAEKKKTRPYDNRKWKEQKDYQQKSFKIKGSNPKDARFSDQQKLRRMFRSS